MAGHDGWKASHFKTPFIPAEAGIQRLWLWVPAFAGTNGKRLGSSDKLSDVMAGHAG
jgi:hypothetical protein